MSFSYFPRSIRKESRSLDLPGKRLEQSNPEEKQRVRMRVMAVSQEVGKRQDNDDDEDEGDEDEEDDEDDEGENEGEDEKQNTSKLDDPKTETSRKPENTETSEPTPASITETRSESSSSLSSNPASTTATVSSSLPSTITSTASSTTSSAAQTSTAPEPKSGIGTGGIIASSVFGACVFIALVFVVVIYFKRWRGFMDRRKDERRKSSLYPYTSVAMSEDGGPEAGSVQKQEEPAYSRGGFSDDSNSERLPDQSYEQSEYGPIQGTQSSPRFHTSIDASHRKSIADISSSELHLPDQSPRTHRRSFSYPEPMPAMPALAESSQEDLSSSQTDIPLYPIPPKTTSYHERRESRRNSRSSSVTSLGGRQPVPSRSGSGGIDAATFELPTDSRIPTNA